MTSSKKLFLVLFLLGLLATFPHWTRFHDLDDEATAAVLGATRLLQGELPYRDWTTRHTPGSAFLSALWFLFCGSGQLGIRSLMAVVSSLTGLAIFSCARSVAGGPWPYLPWILWTCGGLLDKPNLSHHWFAGLATLVVLRLGVHWVEHRRPQTAAWLGFSAALTSWFLQSNGLTALLTIVFLTIRFRPPGVARLLTAYLGTQALLWLPWIGLLPQVWDNHFDGMGRHLLFNRHPYSWGYLSDLLTSTLNISQVQSSVHSLAAWGYLWHEFPQYGLFFWVIVPGVALAERRRNPAGTALAYGCLAWSLTLGPCVDLSYLSFAAPAFQLGLMSWLSFRWPGREALAGIWAVGEVLAWGVVAASITDAYRYPVVTRSGTYYTPDQQEAQTFIDLHAWLEQNVPAGSKVLAYPYFSRMYALEKLRNPIPQPILLPWLYPERDFVQCAAILRREKVPYILYRNLDFHSIQSAYPATPMADFQREWAIQGERVFQGYHKVWSRPGYEIWARQ